VCTSSLPYRVILCHFFALACEKEVCACVPPTCGCDNPAPLRLAARNSISTVCPALAPAPDAVDLANLIPNSHQNVHV
jgi:hypothetical protein